MRQSPGLLERTVVKSIQGQEGRQAKDPLREVTGELRPSSWNTLSPPRDSIPTKTWKESNDPERDTKLDRIEEVLAAPDRCFAFDELGPLAVHPIGGCCCAAETSPSACEPTATRTAGCGSPNGCYSTARTPIWGVVLVRERKSVKNSLAAIKSCRAARTDGARIYVILDNLSAHKAQRIRDWCAKNNVRRAVHAGLKRRR